MMKICPECGGKIPETESECPICGCLQDPCYQDNFPAESEVEEQREQKTPEKKSGGFRRFLLELFLFVFALAAIGFIVIATDFNGARTELRRMCMTDSGDGSGADTQLSRIRVKHYILVWLNFFDHGGTGESTRINPEAFNRKHLSEPEKKNDLKKPDEPSVLPPTPPDVKPLDLPEVKSVEPPSAKGEVFPETAAPEKKTPAETETVPAS